LASEGGGPPLAAMTYYVALQGRRNGNGSIK